jgi:hypothetical protein
MKSFVAATLFATAVAMGAASVHPAIASAAKRPGARVSGGWDIEAYDRCMAHAMGDMARVCCETSGGVWHKSTNPGYTLGYCSAPPANNK